MSGEDGSVPDMPDLGALLSRLGEVQQNLQQAQESAASKVLEGSAGGGAVRVQATGDLEFQQVTIDRSVVDLDDIEMLQDLILAAVNDALDKSRAAAAANMSQLTAGLGLPPGLL